MNPTTPPPQVGSRYLLTSGFEGTTHAIIYRVHNDLVAWKDEDSHSLYTIETLKEFYQRRPIPLPPKQSFWQRVLQFFA